MRKKNELMNDVKKKEIYKNIIKKFPDANLIDIELEKEQDDK